MSKHIIDNMDKLKQKADLVASLTDIAVAFKASTRAKTNKRQKTEKSVKVANPIDSNYDALKCNIKTLKPTDE